MPYTNEICNVLTSSGYKIFKHLYRPCIDEYLLDEKVWKHIKKDKICKKKDVISKLIIDLIALSGIILNIGRATLEYGYFFTKPIYTISLYYYCHLLYLIFFYIN